ncbi:MAG: recombinase family protein [Mogibacterium sp.]|nr:recombinase family protein [Mogibacterium sp.]
MTVYAAFGQAESDSARENGKLAFKREMEEGRPRQALEKRFGYRLAGDGSYIPDQNAKWVVKMYELAAEGYTCRQIARYLEENGVKTDRGAVLTSSSIGRMIRSVVYKGDFIMQEHYTNDERRIVKNRGELPQVYIKDDHPRIVSDELWDKANEMLEKRLDGISANEPYLELNDKNFPYRNKLYCAECGHKLQRRKSGGAREGFQGKIIWCCGGVKE